MWAELRALPAVHGRREGGREGGRGKLGWRAWEGMSVLGRSSRPETLLLFIYFFGGELLKEFVVVVCFVIQGIEFRSFH